MVEGLRDVECLGSTTQWCDMKLRLTEQYTGPAASYNLLNASLSSAISEIAEHRHQ